MATQPATSTSTVIQRLWTQEEYWRLPEGPPYYELEDGRLIEWPLRSRRHQTIVGKLTAALSRYLDRYPLGEVWFGVAVELTPARTYIPDLSFLLTENLDAAEQTL
jgi:Uma2 family endonuclease